MHRIVLVDDHEVVRNGLADLISGYSGFEVAGQAASAEETLDLVSADRPTLVVADLILGDGPDGIQLTKGLKARDPLLPVLVLSGRDESLFAERALLAGAAGYVMKDDAVDVLQEAMLTAISGQLWLSRAMRDRLLPPALFAPVPSDRIEDPALRELLEEMRRGNRTTIGLSRLLGRAPMEVERGLDELQEQLQLPSRAALLLLVR